MASTASLAPEPVVVGNGGTMVTPAAKESVVGESPATAGAGAGAAEVLSVSTPEKAMSDELKE